MLKLIVLGQEHWDEKKQEFVYNKEVSLQLEHSLVSLSKWEAKWKKPYLSREPLSYEETVDYIRCMTLTECVASTSSARNTLPGAIMRIGSFPFSI